jgi:hypothetical protein
MEPVEPDPTHVTGAVRETGGAHGLHDLDDLGGHRLGEG